MLVAEGGLVSNISEHAVSLNSSTIVEQKIPEELRLHGGPNSVGSKIPKGINLKPTGDSANVVVDLFLRKHTAFWWFFSILSAPENICAMSRSTEPGYEESSQREREPPWLSQLQSWSFVYMEGESLLCRWNPEQWNRNLRMSLNF
ncbi:hypothetical protein ACQP3J_26180, partial [Escherichia coli]